MTTNHTTKNLLQQAVARLADRSESPQLDAELLLAHVLQQSRTRLRSHPEDMPDAAARERYAGLIERRANGEPLAYIVGSKGFWTLELEVTPDVLVPRPETELIVERALELPLPEQARVVDLGTGSGAIALAIASERPRWQVTATDVSAAALAVARANAARLGLAPPTSAAGKNTTLAPSRARIGDAGNGVEFIAGDWFAALAGRRFDLVVSNPPYIGAAEPEMRSPALRYEPAGALSPGSDGLASLHILIESAPEHLQPGGWLLLEHGYAQGPDVARALVARGFSHVTSRRDLAGHERMTEAHWASR